MKQKPVEFKSSSRILILLLVVLSTSACSLNEEKDILFVRHNLEDFHTETTQYKDKITFTLTTNELLKGIDAPKKIAAVYDTDIFIREVTESENSISKEKEISVLVDFDSKFNSKNGTMVSLFRLNDGNTYTHDVKLQAFNEEGKTIDFAYAMGDDESRFEQNIEYVFKKEELIKSKEYTFEINDLYLLNYSEK